MKMLGTKPYFGLITILLAIPALLFVPRTTSAWNSAAIDGGLPTLQFTMTRASDARTVTATDYRGKIVLLYFGYTFCPDVCPTTLVNLSQMLKVLPADADDVRVLFVTVDPDRDTLSALARYTESFAPQVVGLRGTPDQLAALAKRYRVAYSVQPAGHGRDYEVTHGSAVYVFDRNGAARLLFTGLSTAGAGLTGMIEDLRKMITATGSRSWWTRMLQFMGLSNADA